METDPIELRRKQLILDIREADRIGDQNEEKRRIRLIHETEMMNKLVCCIWSLVFASFFSLFIFLFELFDIRSRRHYDNLSLQTKARKIRDLQVELISLGYTFNPEDGLLVCHYLREKCLDGDLLFHSIEDADVYAKHPQNLIGIFFRYIIMILGFRVLGTALCL